MKLKRVLMLMFSALLVLTLTACGGNGTSNASSPNEPAKATATEQPKNDKQTAEQNAKSKVLVAYFSCTGETKALAETTARVLAADVYEIRPEVPYTSADLNYNDESTRATVEQKDDNARPALADNNANIAAYDVVVLAYPIWWGQAPRIMDTFVEAYDFSGKTIVPICTSGGSDVGSSADNLQKIMRGKADWKTGKRLNAHASERDVAEWLTGLGL